MCLDCCNNPHFDIRVLDSIRPYLRFLSTHTGAWTLDRTRGRGAFAWDAPERTGGVLEAIISNPDKRKGAFTQWHRLADMQPMKVLTANPLARLDAELCPSRYPPHNCQLTAWTL
jgi:hypothetical protein